MTDSRRLCSILEPKGIGRGGLSPDIHTGPLALTWVAGRFFRWRALCATGARLRSTMTVMFIGLFVLGLGMLIRGLITVSKTRTAWTARSVAATAKVLTCRAIPRSEPGGFETFHISVAYDDTSGQSRTADLPASQQFQPGDPIDIRFDPKHPATVYLSEQFQGRELPAALIVFGASLMLVSLASVTN